MKRIGVLSDTHNFLDEKVFTFFAECDEIWHAGDIGSLSIYNKLKEFKPLRAVHGNIDSRDLYDFCPRYQIFTVEDIKVVLTHIAGYPGRFTPEIKQLLLKEKPHIICCGHSHILKVMFDKKFNCLSINPGASGQSGFHAVKTILRFEIDGDKIENMEVLEMGTR